MFAMIGRFPVCWLQSSFVVTAPLRVGASIQRYDEAASIAFWSSFNAAENEHE